MLYIIPFASQRRPPRRRSAARRALLTPRMFQVLERGLKAIPLSVDLWIHYLNHIKATRAEDHVYIRSQYERAIGKIFVLSCEASGVGFPWANVCSDVAEACGLEFRSDRLWESYIKWEAENGSALNVTNIYDRLLATPTLGYTSHFDKFVHYNESISAWLGFVNSFCCVKFIIFD